MLSQWFYWTSTPRASATYALRRGSVLHLPSVRLRAWLPSWYAAVCQGLLGCMYTHFYVFAKLLLFMNPCDSVLWNVFQPQSVFDLSSRTWALLNRFRTSQGPYVQICTAGALPTQLSMNADNSRLTNVFFHFSNVFKTKKLQKQHISINKFQQKHLKTAAMNILCRCRNQSCVYFSLFFLYGAFCTSTYGMKMSGLFCIFWQDLYRLLSALYTLAKVEDVHYS